MQFIEWLKEWWVTILAVLVAVAALLAVVYLHGGVLRSLSEAIFLAATLTVTVDPFLKRRLQKDVAKDIFHHLLGIDLPPEIRDAFQKALFGHDNYRKDFDVDVNARRSSNASVSLEVAIRSKVIAVRETNYEQILASEESENARLLQASVTCDLNPTKNYSCSQAGAAQSAAELTMKPKENEPMAFEWKGRKIPMRKGEVISTYLKFNITRGIRDFWTLSFSSPTIYPRVRVTCSAELTITASRSEQVQQNGNEYNYREVFVPGGNIVVRWEPKPYLTSASIDDQKL